MSPWAYGIIYGDHRQHHSVVLDRGAAELLAVKLHGVLVPLVPMHQADCSTPDSSPKTAALTEPDVQ